MDGSKTKRSRTSADPEIATMAAITRLLERLDKSQRGRVVDWLMQRNLTSVRVVEQ